MSKINFTDEELQVEIIRVLREGGTNSDIAESVGIDESELELLWETNNRVKDAYVYGNLLKVFDTIKGLAIVIWYAIALRMNDGEQYS